MAFLPFRQQPPAPVLPGGFELHGDHTPSAQAINSLLASCSEATPPAERWSAALERSYGYLCILESNSGELVGFVRITSDQALNANLWDLLADPTDPGQAKVLAVLVHAAVARLRREVGGCSISLSARPEAVAALVKVGFIVDPGGIRAMGLDLRTRNRPRD